MKLYSKGNTQKELLCNKTNRDIKKNTMNGLI